MKKDVKFIQASSYRTKTLKSLAKSPKIPSKIAKDCNIRTNHISNILKVLKERDLVYCINPEMHKGKIYKLTEYGEKVAKKVKE